MEIAEPRLLLGDCLERMRELPNQSVHTFVTSPPYFGLRDYGMEGQIGLEETPGAFVQRLVEVFREVRRVLRDDGTLWLNLGDTMNNRRRIRSTSHQPSLNGFKEGTWAEASKAGLTRLSINDGDLKEKDAMGIPWQVAFALRADGWFLRQEIIWAKGFGKPEPSKDRLPTRHEPIFLLSKSKRYSFYRDAMPSWAAGSVWSVPPVGLSGHGATFPPDLIEPCILAGAPIGGTVLDPLGGSGTTVGVAIKHGRQAILCELNPEYAALITERVRSISGVVPWPAAGVPVNDNEFGAMSHWETLLRSVLTA